MEMTNEYADRLLRLPKMVTKGGETRPRMNIDQRNCLRARFDLIAEAEREEDEIRFLWDIHLSEKDRSHITLHFQENGNKLGLLRVDFNGGHQNPVLINEYLPGKFFPYAGRLLLRHEHHIHYHVQGYKPLAWAIPLTDDDFWVKGIVEDDISTTFANAIHQFAKTINLGTELTVYGTIL
jgi:hypothetical protein